MSKKDSTKKDIPTKALTRDEIRKALLGNAPKPTHKDVTLFGIKLELRQPTLGGILAAQDIEDARERAVDTIVNYSYVPGTNERVFEVTDKDVILGWPFTEELVTIQVAVAEMTGVDITEAETELKGAPLDKRS